MAALPANTYTLGVLRPGGQMLRRENRPADEVRRAIPWLRRENARGAAIYGRPAGTGYVAVDDIPAEQLRQAEADGFRFAAVIESSPGNLCGWLRLPQHLATETSTAAGIEFARRYGADANTDHNHFLRLPGFTNRKPEHERNGRYPFAKLRRATGAVIERFDTLMEWAQERLESRRREKEREKRVEAIDAVSAAASGPTAAFQRQARKVRDELRRHGDPRADDWSVIDYRAAQRLVLAGQPTHAIAAAIRDGSPSITDRKQGHVEDYAKRTAVKAEASDWVTQERAKRARQKAEDTRGPGPR